MAIKTKEKDFTIRFANEDDVGLILGFIQELATYGGVAQSSDEQ